jgi:vacuolar-type H+-ATPase subunit C/Vma6
MCGILYLLSPKITCLTLSRWAHFSYSYINPYLEKIEEDILGHKQYMSLTLSLSTQFLFDSLASSDDSNLDDCSSTITSSK